MALILVSNDDGIDAPGLKALREAVNGLGKVIVFALLTRPRHGRW